jgi:ABC-type sugar transport system substrate-binding protein
MNIVRRTLLAGAIGLLAASGANAQAVKELRIGYQPSPLQDASVAMFETWGAKNGVKIVKVPTPTASMSRR